MRTPLSEYRRRVEHGELEKDPAQETAVMALERLFQELNAASPVPRGWQRGLAKLMGRKPTPIRGLYLWGSVGRGKTLLMDLFYNCLPFEDKLRRHFHRFMAGVHEDLRSLRDRQDPLELVADKLASQTRIICFDEFAVTDIADAMILGNLFAALFERGVSLTATSNIEPARLYYDGLQRQRFLRTIELIEQHTQVLKMDGDLDYRLQFLEHAAVYQYPADREATRRLAEFFTAIAPDLGDTEGVMDILGRTIEFERRADGVVWFDFEQICDGPRSQDDYIELSRCFQSVVISNVPRFTAMLENQARRFIALVDEFYDRKVKLILSAAVPIDELYAGNKLAHDFERTRSRLIEMQSHDYLAAAHRP